MAAEKDKQKRKPEVLLSRSRTSRAFEPSESLWDDEIGRIEKLLDGHLEELKYLNQQKDHVRPEEFRSRQSILSIALYGTYGSGKSSLLRTLARQVNDDRDTGAWYETFKRVRALDVIEPSLLSNNTNFLYAFLAAALEADAKKHHGYQANQVKESRIITPVEQRFHNVSEYLQAIDEDHYSKGSSEDHLNLSFHRLERHTSAFLLKEKLYDFIDTLVDSLTGITGNSVLLMPVDDADMLPDILVDTLRNIQLYLRHPRLVPIFTFTGRMAEELLRTNYEDKLGVGEKDHALRKITEASTSLTIAENLAVQFLGKIFPVRNRIKLSNASKRVVEAEFFQSFSDKNKNQNNDRHVARREKEEKNAKDDKKVRTLLETATRVLFGHYKWPLMPKISASLESATLRRQMQIIDAMDAADIKLFFEVEDYEHEADYRYGEKANIRKNIDPNSEKIKVPKQKTWASIFDRATWALLNVHRDVLKEFDLNLDDLYSWTKDGLRRTVLGGVLSRRLERRRDLLDQWRYQGKDRRSQMISLLALNAYRPTMVGEWEDDKANIEYKSAYSMSVRTGALWFVNLWCGFYLPQILGRNRPNNTKGQLPDYEPVSSVGWDVINAPYRAVREALNNNLSSSSGILFLRKDSMAEHVSLLIEHSKNSSEISPNHKTYLRSVNHLYTAFHKAPLKKSTKSKSDNSKTKMNRIEFSEHELETSIKKKTLNEIFKKERWRRLILDIWCFYGEDRGKDWSCISLWRPLCLMAQIIESDILFLREVRNAKNNTKDQKIVNSFKNNRKARIKAILINHFRSSEVFGNSYLPTKEAMNRKEEISRKEGENFPWASNWRVHEHEEVIEELVDLIESWLESFDKEHWRINPMFVLKTDDSKKQTEKAEHWNWQMCFIRRLHGSSLLYEFWQELETYKELEMARPRTAISMAKVWLKVLSRYWNCGRKNLAQDESNQSILKRYEVTQNYTRSLILDCPFIKPFSPVDRLAIHQIASYIYDIGSNVENDNILDKAKDLKKAATKIRNAWDSLSKENLVFELHNEIIYAYLLSIDFLETTKSFDALKNENKILTSMLCIQIFDDEQNNLKYIDSPDRLTNIYEEVKNAISLIEKLKNQENETNRDTIKKELRECVNNISHTRNNQGKTDKLIPDLHELWANAIFRFEYFASVEGLDTPFINPNNYMSSRADSMK